MVLRKGILRSDYETLAAEYYDANRHPTCANFREGSGILLKAWLRISVGNLVYCDVGAGKSLLAEILAPRRNSIDRLFLIDESPTMLAYSRELAPIGAHLLLADVSDRIPIDGDSVDVVVASLGDPYNTSGFWSEVRRIVKPGGRILYTTPSYEWAAAFRKTEACGIDAAEFTLTNGEVVCVPSYIYPPDKQVAVISRHALVVESIAGISILDLVHTVPSPKLLGLEPAVGVVTGYLVRRPR